MARGILNFKLNRTVSAFPGRSIPPLGTRTSKHFQGKIFGKGSKNSFSILSLPIPYGGKQKHIWATDLRHALYPVSSDLTECFLPAGTVSTPNRAFHQFIMPASPQQWDSMSVSLAMYFFHHKISSYIRDIKYGITWQ